MHATSSLFLVDLVDRDPELLDGRHSRRGFLQKLAHELHDAILLPLAHPHSAPSLFGSAKGLTVARVSFFEPSTASA